MRRLFASKTGFVFLAFSVSLAALFGVTRRIEIGCEYRSYQFTLEDGAVKFVYASDSLQPIDFDFWIERLAPLNWDWHFALWPQSYTNTSDPTFRVTSVPM